jgi:hypothetical protein
VSASISSLGKEKGRKGGTEVRHEAALLLRKGMKFADKLMISLLGKLACSHPYRDAKEARKNTTWDKIAEARDIDYPRNIAWVQLRATATYYGTRVVRACVYVKGRLGGSVGRCHQFPIYSSKEINGGRSRAACRLLAKRPVFKYA